MPNLEVLINDSNLNAIANAIRRKNGLVRTYKPREMATAIRAINADAPDSREYTVTVILTPHQTIKVRQVLGGEKLYDLSFTVSEPYWKILVTVEADAGYVAGGLNYPNEVTVDRDITIKATPATEVVVPPDNFIRLNWWTTAQFGYSTGYQSRLKYEDGTNFANGSSYCLVKPLNRNVYQVYSEMDRLPSRLIAMFARDSQNLQIANATDVIIDLENKSGMIYISSDEWQAPPFSGALGLEWLEYVLLKNWNTSEVESIGMLVNNCGNLRSIGDISNWDTSNLKRLQNFVTANSYLLSLDLSGWNTPNLQTATNIFPNGRILDISNWDTTNISSFSAGISAKTKVGVLYPAYLIMDKEEVKFSGNYIFNNIANCKYLVPEDMVDAYKQHPNWQSRASLIESITNYTINRGDGQIEVVPNW